MAPGISRQIVAVTGCARPFFFCVLPYLAFVFASFLPSHAIPRIQPPSPPIGGIGSGAPRAHDHAVTRVAAS
jgi:hypothetical protein